MPGPQTMLLFIDAQKVRQNFRFSHFFPVTLLVSIFEYFWLLIQHET